MAIVKVDFAEEIRRKLYLLEGSKKTQIKQYGDIVQLKLGEREIWGDASVIHRRLERLPGTVSASFIWETLDHLDHSADKLHHSLITRSIKKIERENGSQEDVNFLKSLLKEVAPWMS
jgi:hypothetical protein